MERSGDILVFNKAGTDYVWLNIPTGTASPIYNIKDVNAPLGALQANSVSVAYTRLVERIYFFDETGGTFEIIGHRRQDVGFNEIPTAPFGPPISPPGAELIQYTIDPFFTFDTADDVTIPFLDTGYEAALYLGFRSGQANETDNFLSLDYRYFEKGNAHLTVDSDRRQEGGSITRTWSAVSDIRQNANFPFDGIGAACGLELEFNTFSRMYFNLDGNQFFLANNEEEITGGPYLLYL